MNGPAKLSLAVALALAGGNVFALGLGTIQVRSKLNQPLDAVIPVIADSPAEASGLEVALASADDFQRVGLDRSRVDVPLEFSVGSDHGQTVIKVTTKDIVREPLLDFLIVANWPKGKLLREYTVLLDPPMTAPAAGAASLSPAQEAPRAKPQPLAPESERAAPRTAHVKTPRTESVPAKAPAPAPASKTARAAGSGEYGPVAAGETLSSIASETRADNVSRDAMMLALLKANPNAFYRDNINALKRGAILRIPSVDEIKANGTAAAAATAVREQNQAWASNAPVAKPTLVAKTGAPKEESAPAKSSKSSTSSSDSHLALVPPGTDKGKQNSSDRPGAASGTGNAQTSADLARTKEALASREQEVGELKSRVKDLEKLNDDGKRLLTLKQNEIAELQNKLKQLQAQEAVKPVAAATTVPANKPAATEAKPATAVAATKSGETTAPASNESPKLTAKDIWGDINAGEKPADKNAPAAVPVTAANAPAAKPAGESTPPPAAASAPTTTTPSATVSTEKPAEAKPAESKPVSTPVAVKPHAPAKVEPMNSTELPWWQNNNVLMAGGAALLIIGLLALMRFLRKPKTVVFDEDSMLHDDHAHVDGDEQHLLDELSHNPGDAALSLQLCEHYYAHGDADKFEAAAEAMYAHVADPASPEWQQVRAMGEQLCPHNPLFGGHEDLSDVLHDNHVAAEHLEHDVVHLGDGLHDAHAPDPLTGDFHTQQMHLPAEENFDFGLADNAMPSHAEPAHVEPAHHESIAPAVPAAAAKPVEDFFAGEDAIGTKLDLAKAYLDMGDPEGARSMLDEVMTEGSEAQKTEARKLLAEIG